jgi:predicted alpha/beta hydrolase
MNGIESAEIVAEPITVRADDGYALSATVWRRRGECASGRPVTIVNPATSVSSRYYARFAAFLASHGFDVITYDYRGIGESRPPTLRGFDANWLDWGRLDFEAVLRYAARTFEGRPIDVVAHSIGGLVVGLAPSNHLIRRVFTMGAQFAYWRDYAPRHKLSMLWKWHVVMPALTALCGYFPAGRLGWMEDTPAGVAMSWSRSKARFEDTYRRGRFALGVDERRALVRQFAAVRGPVLALSVTDDEFGTVQAIERLHAYFAGGTVTHVRIAPHAIGERAIGHFSFFHSRFQDSLWPIPLQWLELGTVPHDMPGAIVTPEFAQSGAAATVR